MYTGSSYDYLIRYQKKFIAMFPYKDASKLKILSLQVHQICETWQMYNEYNSK